MNIALDWTRPRSKLDSLVRLTPLPTIEWNLDRRVVEWNPAAEKVFEFTRREALGRGIDENLIVPGDGLSQSLAIWHQVVSELRTVHTVSENTTRGGRRIQCAWYLAPLLGDDGRASGVLSQAQDITAVKDYRRRLHTLSFFDSLTELPNRALFNDRIRQAFGRAERGAVATGLMVLGLDRFKAINDTLGHGVGDQVLREAATRLRQTVRGYDTVARLGGDQFAIVYPDVRAAADLGRLAQKVLNAFARPIVVGERRLYISVSIGIALHPDDGTGVNELLRFAETAMFHAKDKGRGNFQFYSSELTAQAMERLALEADLRLALENEELEVYYQPQVDLSDNRIVGAEALLRWHHPSRGMVMPDKFIGIAEDTGLIVGIGEWVLHCACQTARAWHDAGQNLNVAVNLSPRQFLDGRLAATVFAILEETGCAPEWLELEITEHLLLDDGPSVRQTLDELTAEGIAIAIDDFGTGYSALAYINRFPVSVLKIDRSFVNDINVNQDSAALAEAITTLAKVLRLRVVAEGVESMAQETLLKANGCHVGQGYLYGKPMPLDELSARLPTPRRPGIALAAVT